MITQLRRSLSVLARTSLSFRGNMNGGVQIACSRRMFSSSKGSENVEADVKPEEEVKSDETAEKIAEDTEYAQAVESLKKAEAESKSVHHRLLLKYADAENKRRERVEELRKLDSKHITAFGDKVKAIYDSLEKVSETAKLKSDAPTADEKVKSFSEGLMMTRDIMKNILVKHNIVKS